MILITGGAGYIGSHTALEFANAGHNCLVFDNFSNSKVEVQNRIKSLLNEENKGNITFLKGDLRFIKDIDLIFEKYPIQGIVHFAGLKAVGESVENPLLYYQNNVIGTWNLLHVLEKNRRNSKGFITSPHPFIFSSSATVYGVPKHPSLSFDESHPLHPINPYGNTKLAVERMILDSQKPLGLKVRILRYFNPVGAHSSGLLGEDPNGVPNNLMPFISQVAAGIQPFLKIFGSDYNTKDGTGERDYIHVMDLAEAHLKAFDHPSLSPLILNIGTGKPWSVFQMVRAYEEVIQKTIPYKIVERRPGDLPCYYAVTELSEKTLQWKAKRNILDVCRDQWKWQQTSISKTIDKV